MKFSISVPVGAYHPFLPQCLESLAQQQVPLEVALLDASGDERVRALAQQYASTISYVRHGPDGGQSAAIIEGWNNTGGDILGWLNADDVLFPHTLAKALERFESDAQPDIVYGGSTIVDENDSFIGFHWAVEPPSDRLYESMNISQPSCFFKRAAHDAAGGLLEELHYTMDWNLFIRMRLNGAKFDYIDEPLSKVLWGGDTKTSSFGKERRDEIRNLIEKYTPKGKQNKVFRSFSIHHFLDSLQPAFLQHFIRRLFVRGRQSVNGLSADGSITDTAMLMLCHYGSQENSALRLWFRNTNAVSRVFIPGVASDYYDAPGGGVLIPRSPLLPASVFTVQIEASPQSTAYFERCDWRDLEECKSVAIDCPR